MIPKNNMKRVYTVRMFLFDSSTFANTTIDEVFASDDSLKDVAENWLNSYAEDAPLALTDFVNFLLRSAGCDIQVTVDHINDPDNAAGRLADIQTEYQAVGFDRLGGKFGC